MIVLPAVPPEQTASWLGLLDLHERLAEGWTLIGFGSAAPHRGRCSSGSAAARPVNAGSHPIPSVDCSKHAQRKPASPTPNGSPATRSALDTPPRPTAPASPIARIAAQTRHKDLSVLFDRYIRPVDALELEQGPWLVTNSRSEQMLRLLQMKQISVEVDRDRDAHP